MNNADVFIPEGRIYRLSLTVISVSEWVGGYETLYKMAIYDSSYKTSMIPYCVVYWSTSKVDVNLDTK